MNSLFDITRMETSRTKDMDTLRILLDLAVAPSRKTGSMASALLHSVFHLKIVVSENTNGSRRAVTISMKSTMKRHQYSVCVFIFAFLLSKMSICRK